MTLFPDDGDRGVSPAIALYSILGFWLFYTVLVSLRAAVVGFDSQMEMAARRMVVAVIGIIITWILYLVLRRFDQRPLALRVVAAFSLAAPFALAMAATNYYMFYVYDPTMFADSEMQKKASESYVVVGIVEEAISRFFFLSAWAALYLALSYASEARRVERRAARLEQAAQQAELRSLRYQVNPHFLFNTLNSISTLVLLKQTERANAMLSRLSAFLRYTLANEPTAHVTVAQEVETLKLYLEIEKMRFEDRLRPSFEIDPRAERARLPSLLLQPLVENAIKYAVTPQEEGAEIRVDVRLVGQRVRIAVSDTGPGLHETRHSSSVSTGVGLSNIRERLAQAYGPDHRFESRSAPAGGYSVEIEIPFQLENVNREAA